MSDVALSALVLMVTGVYAVRWVRRLAPMGSELPVKTLAATVLAGLILLAEFTMVDASRSVRVAAVVLAGVYVLGPMLITGLARSGAFVLADVVNRALYWTAHGRSGLRRVLTQLALRYGDAEMAERFLPPEADLLRVQTLALAERWEEVLEQSPIRAEHGEGPAEGDNLALAVEARVEALLALDRFEEAERLVTDLETEASGEGVGPVTHAVAQRVGARLAAARGRVDETRRRLVEPPLGTPSHVMFALLALAAERAAHPASVDMWRQAYLTAPEGFQGRYAEKVQAHGASLPPVTRRRFGATVMLAAWIVLAYLAQVTLDQWVGPVVTNLGRIDPSSLAAAFVLNVPGVPQGDAWWRFLSYAFVHGGIIHIGFNTWVLLDLGRMYEARAGWGNLIASFTLGTAMGAYLTQIAEGVDPVLLVGASGGVLGIAGALLADAVRGQRRGDRALVRSLLQWMAIITLFSFAVPGVSLWGHVGGVVGGLLYGFARQGLPSSPKVSQALGSVSVGLLAAAFTAILLVALQLT